MNAPSGIPLPADDPAVQRTTQRPESATASRASRLLPTPSAPVMTTPTALLDPLSAAAINCNSSARPINGRAPDSRTIFSLVVATSGAYT
jgi:hypothetical protein